VIALIVPVLKNFAGFAELAASIDREVKLVVVPNWTDNIGVSAGWNYGLRKAIDADVAVISNDDVVFQPGMLTMLAQSMHVADVVSAVNIRDGGLPDTVFDFDEHPDFSCFAVKPKDFTDRFGWFDENFSPAYFEDNDMARRVKVGGGSYARNLRAGMLHKGSVTQNMDGPVVTSAMFEENRAYYVRKWGGQPMQETFTHPFNDESNSIKDW